VVSVIVFDALRSDFLKQASAMAYVTLLSLIPSLVAIFCVFSLFTPLFLGQKNLVDEIKNLVLTHLAAGSGENVVRYLDEMLQKLDLKTIGWSSFASVLVTLIMLLRQIEIALNNIWQIKKSRNVFMRFMYFWTFLTLLMLGIGAIVGLSIPKGLKKLVNPQMIVETQAFYTPILKSIVSLCGSWIFFFLLYKVIPNCKVHSRPAAIGALISAILITEGGFLYGLFVRDSDNYKTIYGAMAQLPVFLMWLYLCWSIILLGALISWRIQEGFPKINFHEALDFPQNAAEKYRNLKIKLTLPYLALLSISKRFIEGNQDGLSSQDFAHHYDIPVSWAQDAFEYLIELGYIHPSFHHNSSKSQRRKISAHLSTSYEAGDPFYPSRLPSGVEIDHLSEQLSQSFGQWLSEKEEKLPSTTSEALMQMTFSGDAKHGNLHDLISKINLSL
jgi:membrane protein